MWLPQFISIALTAAATLSTTATAERVGDPIPITSSGLLPTANHNNSINNTRHLSSMANPFVTFITNGSDFIGGDVGSVSGKAWEGCGRECKNHGNCDSFTWTDENGGTCWLKYWVHAMNGKIGAVSGRVSDFYGDPLKGSTSSYANYDMPGNDLRSSPETTSSCSTMCSEMDDCNAFSFTNGICYFKSGASDRVPADGYTSGVVFRYFETLG